MLLNIVLETLEGNNKTNSEANFHV